MKSRFWLFLSRQDPIIHIFNAARVFAVERGDYAWKQVQARLSPFAKMSAAAKPRAELSILFHNCKLIVKILANLLAQRATGKSKVFHIGDMPCKIDKACTYRIRIAFSEILSGYSGVVFERERLIQLRHSRAHIPAFAA